MDDAEIIALYHRRSERAIAETDGKYGPYCRSIARNLLGVREDAEDCALFVRRYWHGDPVKDLAVRQGCTAGQMAQRMLRLRRGLRAFLESEGVCL